MQMQMKMVSTCDNFHQGFYQPTCIYIIEIVPNSRAIVIKKINWTLVTRDRRVKIHRVPNKNGVFGICILFYTGIPNSYSCSYKYKQHLTRSNIVVYVVI